MKPYYADDFVTLYHGDCRDFEDFCACGLLLTDPPYGIAWKKSLNLAAGSRKHDGIKGDADTSLRDIMLNAWGDELPAIVFGSLYAPFPRNYHHVLIWEKPRDAGIVGPTIGFRRDVEAIFLLGEWPKRPPLWGSVIRSVAASAGGAHSPAGRTGHPHAKPIDLLCKLIAAAGVPGGIIADPFAGSGSTLLAAKQLGRMAIGVEIDEAYCEIAAQRLSQDVLGLGGAA